jgi:hypothetical protein
VSVLTALERPRWAVAGTDARYPRNLSELVESTPPVIRRRLDGRCQLIFAVPATQEMRTLLTARRVVLAAPPGEPQSEWIISRTAEIAGPEGRASLAVECDSIRVIMGDVGVIERTTAGGNVVANLGGVNGRPVNYLATYVIPELAKKGVGWIELGRLIPACNSTSPLTPLPRSPSRNRSPPRRALSGRYAPTRTERPLLARHGAHGGRGG